ncbi:MAG: GNAT family N-acetyltransferase [Proteobacteria bacterium]|nr:GNAT family N-acetyltransferase [Pseudomonadota bacterium]
MRPSIQELCAWHLNRENAAVPLPSRLPEPYTLELVSDYEEPLFGELMQKVFFGVSGSLRWVDLGFEEDAALRRFRRDQLRTRPSLRIAARCDDALVGWCFGFADRPDSMYMASSAVLEGHRRVGLYTAMAEQMRDLAIEAGFHQLHSKHLCTNNAILIAKLQMGFQIVGMELSPDMGSLLKMELPLHALRADTLRARAGQTLLSKALSAQLTE